MTLKLLGVVSDLRIFLIAEVNFESEEIADGFESSLTGEAAGVTGLAAAGTTELTGAVTAGCCLT